MIELDFVYWHWVVFGLVMLAIEIVLPTFTLFWFGCGALVVGIVLALFPFVSVEHQLILWALVSVLFTLGWFAYFKPKFQDKTQAKLSRDTVVGSQGIVIQSPIEGKKGTVRFSVPVMGNEDWLFITDDSVQNGDRVTVIDVLGNAFKVKKTGGK